VVVALIGGGARSGKSRFAREYAEARFSRLALVATAQPLDVEMQLRIARHRAERGPRWTTIEEPLDLVAAMGGQAGCFDVFLIDCLTLWLSNILLTPGREPAGEILRLVEGLAAGPPSILVANEVGCGIVPENELARLFRDLSGMLNRRVAEVAREVYWMAFGLPVRIKGGPVST